MPPSCDCSGAPGSGGKHSPLSRASRAIVCVVTPASASIRHSAGVEAAHRAQPVERDRDRVRRRAPPPRRRARCARRPARSARRARSTTPRPRRPPARCPAARAPAPRSPRPRASPTTAPRATCSAPTIRSSVLARARTLPRRPYAESPCPRATRSTTPRAASARSSRASCPEIAHPSPRLRGERWPEKLAGRARHERRRPRQAPLRALRGRAWRSTRTCG